MRFEDCQPFLTNRQLHLVLMPTEQCNFRCTYCYEDFLAGEMPRRVVDSVKALMARRSPRLDQLSIEWFGGEPLLAFRLIEEIQGLARQLAVDHPGMAVAGSMTTNGYLLRKERFSRLVDLGVTRYQISLDGTQPAHDGQRRRLGGGGSFEVIWRNLLMMRDHPGDFRILLRLHATRNNVEDLEQLVEDLAQELESDPRFRVMLKAVRHFGGPNDVRVPVLERHREDRVLDRLGRRAADLGLAVQGDPFATPDILKGCYAAAANSFVVRSNGDLAKCTVALRHPNNHVGKLCRDGTFELNSRRMTGWIRGVLEGDEESVRCPMKGWAEPVPESSDSRLPPLIQLNTDSLSGASAAARPPR